MRRTKKPSVLTHAPYCQLISSFLWFHGLVLDTWKNRAEQESKAQAYDEEMIREAKRSEVEEEIRRQVDVLMREELDLLKIVSNHLLPRF